MPATLAARPGRHNLIYFSSQQIRQHVESTAGHGVNFVRLAPLAAMANTNMPIAR